MGYVFLMLALLCNAVKGYCGKQTSGVITGYHDTLIANLLRMALCLIISLGFIAVGGDIARLAPSLPLLGIALLSGVGTSVFMITWLLTVKRSAYLMLDIFVMLSTLVPTVLGIFLFGEQVRPSQWLGIGILLCSVLIMCSYNNSIKSHLTPAAVVILIIYALGCGLADFSQKLFVRTLPDTPISVFNFYTYVFSSLCLLICLLFTGSKKSSNRQTDFRRIFFYIFIMAACMFANLSFKTRAALYLDSVLLYPLSQGAALILATVMSALFFGEKPTRKCILGLCVAFIGILVINVL